MLYNVFYFPQNVVDFKILYNGQSALESYTWTSVDMHNVRIRHYVILNSSSLLPISCNLPAFTEMS
jgi:hypothetical protein